MPRGRHVALAFALLTAALTWPQVLHPLSVPDHADPYFNMWRLAWIAHQLPRDPLHLLDANTLAPLPNTLAYSDAVLLPGAIGAPLIWLGMPVVLACNLQILATFVLCGLGMFLLVRQLTASPVAGVVAGIIYAFAPYRFDHYFHLELVSAQWMPLALWMLHKTIDTGRWRHGVWTGVFVALQALSGVYLAVFLATILVVIGPLLLWSARASIRRRAALALGVGALVAAVVVVPYSFSYRAAKAVVGERGAAERAAYAAGPKHYLAAMPDSLLYGGLTGAIGVHEKRLFPGLTAVLLIGIALWPPIDRRRLAYAVGLAVSVDISFGHRGIVGAWLQDHVELYRGLRVVARIGAVVQLLAGILAGFGVARLLGRTQERRRLLVAALVLIPIAEFSLRPMKLLPVETEPGAVYRWLVQQPAGIVAEFPMPARWKTGAEIARDESRFTYNSTFHWRPIVNGYSGFWPSQYVLLSRDVEHFPEEEALRALRDYGVEYLVLHERFYGADRYRTITSALGARTDLEAAGPFADEAFETRAYRLTRAPIAPPRR